MLTQSSDEDSDGGFVFADDEEELDFEDRLAARLQQFLRTRGKLVRSWQTGD